MYKFIDVNEVSESASLPSEALQLNGAFIEDQIAGYRTLGVTGREALSPELNYFETGVRDGAVLQSRRFPVRKIIVKYQLMAKTSEEFRAAYNTLGGILNVENAEMIFNDEPDKYFTGTPSLIGDVEPGSNSVVGEIEFTCTDPFKYSVEEFEAIPEVIDGCIVVNYMGTQKSYPILEADFFSEPDATEDGETELTLTGSGECGYVAFFNENEKIVQIGNPDETDGVSVAKSQTLVNSVFDAKTSFGTAAKKQWSVNTGVVSSDAVETNGKIGMKVATYATYGEETKLTAQHLLDVSSTAEAPTVHYSISARATGRTADSVHVDFIIDTQLDKKASRFGKGFILKGHIYVGGAWREVTLKKKNAKWQGRTVHRSGFRVTVTGLANDTDVLKNIKFKATRGDNNGNTGKLSETKCKNMPISKWVQLTPDKYYLSCSDFMTGSKWHGASITRTIPADATGEIGAKNFVLTYSQKMAIGKNGNSERGAFQCLLVNRASSGTKVVAGVNVYKGDTGRKAKLRFYINSTVMETTEIDLSNGNAYFKEGKSTTIKKTGETVEFNVCGIKRVFRNSAITDVPVTEFTFTMTKYGITTPLSYNGLYWAKFVKDNCSTWKDVPNKFSANDIVEADCKNGEIYLNGVSVPMLGALGNDWEDFYLKPGLNQIGFAYSDWCPVEYAPEFKVRYREVFL